MKYCCWESKEGPQAPDAEGLNSVFHVSAALWPGNREQEKRTLTSCACSAKAAVCAVSKNLGYPESRVIILQCWPTQRMTAYCHCLFCCLQSRGKVHDACGNHLDALHWILSRCRGRQRVSLFFSFFFYTQQKCIDLYMTSGVRPTSTLALNRLSTLILVSKQS